MAQELPHMHWPEGHQVGDPVRHQHPGGDVRYGHDHDFYSDADYAEGRRYHAGKHLEFQGLYGGAAGRAFLEHLRRTEAAVVGSYSGCDVLVSTAMLSAPCCLADCQDGSCAYCQGWRRYWERVKAKAKRRLPVGTPFGRRRPLPPQQARYDAKQVLAAPGCEWVTVPKGIRCDDLAPNEVWINERRGFKHYCDKHAKMYERNLNDGLRKRREEKEADEGDSVQINDERLREIRRYGSQQGRRAAAAAVTVLTRGAMDRFAPDGPEETAILGAALRRGFFDGIRRRLHTRVNDVWWERRYAHRLGDLQGVRRGLAARKAGRVRPWREVREELGL